MDNNLGIDDEYEAIAGNIEMIQALGFGKEL